MGAEVTASPAHLNFALAQNLHLNSYDWKLQLAYCTQWSDRQPPWSH